jgi:hypothetical protein
MLVEVPYKKGDTVSMKLISGEEIVARIEEEKADSYYVHKPLTLMQGPKGLVLGQWLVTSDPLDDVRIPKSNIMVITKTLKDHAKRYIEATTGIQTV